MCLNVPLSVKQIFHSFTVLSFDPVAIQFPSKENAQQFTYLNKEDNKYESSPQVSIPFFISNRQYEIFNSQDLIDNSPL